jgi:hypothetical protein
MVIANSPYGLSRPAVGRKAGKCHQQRGQNKRKFDIDSHEDRAWFEGAVMIRACRPAAKNELGELATTVVKK